MREYSILGTLAIAITIGFSGIAQADLNDGLVAYYPFDGDANDMSGNGHHGTEHNGITYTSGRINQAATFDGISTYIQVPHSDSLNLNHMTLSAWVYENTDTNDFSLILVKGNWSTTGDQKRQYQLTSTFARDNIANLGILNNSNQQWEWIKSNKKTPIKQWVHIAASYDGNKQKIFINGELEQTRSIAFSPFIPSEPEDMTIGAGFSDETLDNMRDGMIDELHIYNRALSESEIKELYQKTNSTGCTNNPSLGISNNITMLDDNNTLTLLEKAKVFGANGTEIVKIANTPNATIDSNIERIEFSKNLDNYIFSLTGNILNISNSYGVVANITTSDRLIRLAFKDGSVNFNLTGLDNGIFSEGALTLSNNFDIANIKSILNTNDPSDSTLVNIGSIVSQCAQ